MKFLYWRTETVTRHYEIEADSYQEALDKSDLLDDDQDYVWKKTIGSDSDLEQE